MAPHIISDGTTFAAPQPAAPAATLPATLPATPSTTPAPPLPPTPLELSQAHLSKCLLASPIYAFLMQDAVIQPTTSSGLSVADVVLTPNFVNSKGSLHGSVSCTLVDWSSGNALSTMNRGSGVSVDMHTTFLSAQAKVGDTIRIEGKVDRLGKRLAYTSVRITKVGNGEVITLASHTKFVG